MGKDKRKRQERDLRPLCDFCEKEPADIQVPISRQITANVCNRCYINNEEGFPPPPGGAPLVVKPLKTSTPT